MASTSGENAGDNDVLLITSALEAAVDRFENLRDRFPEDDAIAMQIRDDFLLETLPMCVGIRWTARFKGPLYKPVLTAVVMVGVTALGAVAIYGAVTDSAPGELYQKTIQSMGLFMNDISGTSELSVQEQQQVQWMVERIRVPRGAGDAHEISA